MLGVNAFLIPNQLYINRHWHWELKLDTPSFHEAVSTWKKLRFNLQVRCDFNIMYILSLAVHAFANRVLTSDFYVGNLLYKFRKLTFSVEISLHWLKHETVIFHYT